MFTVHPIGRIASPVRDPALAPRQGRDAGTEVSIVVDPKYLEGLEGVGEWKRILVICWLHLADRGPLTIHPRGNPENPERGVFSTRSPVRPNPIALYNAEIVAVEGGVITVRGIDAVDGTPVIDIRPHVPRLDD